MKGEVFLVVGGITAEIGLRVGLEWNNLNSRLKVT